MKLDRRTCDQWNVYDANVLRLSNGRSRKRGTGFRSRNEAPPNSNAGALTVMAASATFIRDLADTPRPRSIVSPLVFDSKD